MGRASNASGVVPCTLKLVIDPENEALSALLAVLIEYKALVVKLSRLEVKPSTSVTTVVRREEYAWV